nr:hypothetical protein [Thermus tengchongensis]
MQETGLLGQAEGQVGQEGWGEEVAFAEVEAQEGQEEGDGQELGEGSFLVALRFGEADALGLEGLEGVRNVAFG